MNCSTVLLLLIFIPIFFFGSLIIFLGLIKFYLTEKVEREEVWYIVEYLTSVTDPEQIQEVLDVLLSLCERASKSKMAKRLSGKDVRGLSDAVFTSPPKHVKHVLMKHVSHRHVSDFIGHIS